MVGARDHAVEPVIRYDLFSVIGAFTGHLTPLFRSDRADLFVRIRASPFIYRHIIRIGKLDIDASIPEIANACDELRIELLPVRAEQIEGIKHLFESLLEFWLIIESR